MQQQDDQDVNVQWHVTLEDPILPTVSTVNDVGGESEGKFMSNILKKKFIKQSNRKKPYYTKSKTTMKSKFFRNNDDPINLDQMKTRLWLFLESWMTWNCNGYVVMGNAVLVSELKP